MTQEEHREDLRGVLLTGGFRPVNNVEGVSRDNEYVLDVQRENDFYKFAKAFPPGWRDKTPEELHEYARKGLEGMKSRALKDATPEQVVQALKRGMGLVLD